VKTRHLLVILILLLLAACGTSGPSLVPAAQLPDPAIYSLRLPELPEVGVSWQQTYNQTSEEQGYKWSYQAFQAYQPAGVASELDTAFAVNNDVILYEVDMSREDLPLPPQALGDIQGVAWNAGTPLHKVGDKSAVWKTSLGELLTPAWWLEFYQGHAYVRISLLGFPDQIAPAIIYGLADIVAARLPTSEKTLRSDVATVIPTQLPATPSITPQASSAETTVTPTLSLGSPADYVPVLSYIAPPGETGMVSYQDDTGSQLTDGAKGSDDILTELENGIAYEWVGWTDLTEPVTLTFTLPAGTKVSAVEIGLYHRDGLGIFVPSGVMINGENFSPDAGAVPNNQRRDLTFSGSFDGPVVTIVLNHRGRGWILVDEVRFIAGK
jgi:predicted small lipoprotein YifL